jgi:hypothetical protein
MLHIFASQFLYAKWTCKGYPIIGQHSSITTNAFIKEGKKEKGKRKVHWYASSCMRCYQQKEIMEKFYIHRLNYKSNQVKVSHTSN